MTENIQLNHHAHQTSRHKKPLCFLANDIRSPENVGSLFRIADALGIEKLFLTGSTAAPPNTKISRISRSTEKHVPYHIRDDALAVITELKNSGYTIVSLEITSNSVDLSRFQVEKNKKICLIIGSEKDGICQQLLDASDLAVHIPMQGVNSSMNVANACAIASYRMTIGLD